MKKWNAYPNDGVVSEGGRIIADKLKDGEADLIAAAPDLLAALGSLIDELDEFPERFRRSLNTLTAAQFAVARAMGESEEM